MRFKLDIVFRISGRTLAYAMRRLVRWVDRYGLQGTKELYSVDSSISKGAGVLRDAQVANEPNNRMELLE
jgi:hypothetical protein